jgi:hypothetical protein
MEYKPLPPMIPISACGNLPPERPPHRASQAGDYTVGESDGRSPKLSCSGLFAFYAADFYAPLRAKELDRKDR